MPTEPVPNERATVLRRLAVLAVIVAVLAFATAAYTAVGMSARLGTTLSRTISAVFVLLGLLNLWKAWSCVSKRNDPE